MPLKGMPGCETRPPPAYLDAPSVGGGDPGEGLGGIDAAGRVAVLPRLGREDSAVERAEHVGARGAVHDPFRAVRIAVHGQFEEFGALPESANVALIVPCFQVGRRVDRVSVALIQDHYPMAAGRIPKYFRVARILAVPYLLGVYHRIAGVFGERAAVVEAVCDTLHLPAGARRGVGGYHRGRLPAVEPGAVFAVDYRRTREHRSQAVGIERVGQLLPVHQVAAHGVAPVHVLPLAFIGVVLVEEVVFVIVVNQPVGVVDPSPARCEVELRPVFLAVERVFSGDPVVLVNPLQPARIAVVTDCELLPAERRDIPEDPVVGLVRGQSDNDRKRGFFLGSERHPASRLVVRDGYVDIFFRHFERDAVRLCAGARQRQERAKQQRHRRA